MHSESPVPKQQQDPFEVKDLPVSPPHQYAQSKDSEKPQIHPVSQVQGEKAIKLEDSQKAENISSSLQNSQRLDEDCQSKEINMGSQKMSQSRISEKQGSPSKATGREQKYKRSTNNSHKKFISIARRWTFKNSVPELKPVFQQKFHEYKSTRTFFFIILAYIKTSMPADKQEQFQTHFSKQMAGKIEQYEKQIISTDNQNLKNFRSDEIIDLKFSVRAFNHYFTDDSLEKAIECVYKKDKQNIVKRQHFEEALRIVRKVQAKFKEGNEIAQLIEKYKQSGKPKSKSKSRAPQLNPDGSVVAKKHIVRKRAKKLNTIKPFGFLTPEMFGFEKGIVQKVSRSNSKKETVSELETNPSRQLKSSNLDLFSNQNSSWQNCTKSKGEVLSKRSAMNYILVSPDDLQRESEFPLGFQVSQSRLGNFKPYFNS